MTEQQTKLIAKIKALQAEVDHWRWHINANWAKYLRLKAGEGGNRDGQRR